jgi:hypothetical protein
VPQIAFGTGGLPGAGRAAGRGVPKIAFGAGGQRGAAGARRRGVPKIAFGTGGLPGAGRAAGRGVPKIGFGSGKTAAAPAGVVVGVPKIQFGTGGLPGAGRARGRQLPKIAFARGLPRAPRTSPGSPALPRFRTGSARSASGSWLAGSRLRSALLGAAGAAGPGRQPNLGFGVPGYRAKSSRRLASVRWRRRRRYLRWLPIPRRAGGRSEVWRITRQIGEQE